MIYEIFKKIYSKYRKNIVYFLPIFIFIFYGCSSADAANKIYFNSDRDGDFNIYSIDSTGENEAKLTQSQEDDVSPIISPDRDKIAFVSGSGKDKSINVMKNDGTIRSVISNATTGFTSSTSSPLWAPNGKNIAYLSKQPDRDQINIVQVDGGGTIRLTTLNGREIGDWSRQNNTILFSVIEKESIGIYTRNPDGVNQFRVTETADYNAKWSPSADTIIFLSMRDGNSEIYSMTSTGKSQRNLTNSEFNEHSISWSPDGKNIMFVSDKDGNPEIYIMDSTGGNIVRLTNNDVRDDQPVWSPDGKQIAFVSYLDGDAEIFVMKSDGSDQRRITNNDFHDSDPAW